MHLQAVLFFGGGVGLVHNELIVFTNEKKKNFKAYIAPSDRHLHFGRLINERDHLKWSKFHRKSCAQYNTMRT